MLRDRSARTGSPAGAVALLLGSATSMQAGAVIAKQLFPVVGPPGTAALRLFFAALVLGALLRPRRTRLNTVTWRSVFVYGLALGGMKSFYYVSISTVPLGAATALEFTGPFVVAVLTSRRSVDFVWIALAALGLLLLLPIGHAAAGIDGVGAAFRQRRWGWR